MLKLKLVAGGLATIIFVLAVAYFLIGKNQPEPELVITPEPEPEPEVILPPIETKVIGQSVEGRNITVTTIGAGERNVLFVGGIHGGYEWNSVALAYQMINSLEQKIELIPEDITVHIIPNLNPDGVYEVVGKEGKITLEDIADPTTRVAAGRFNANEVDLNRNFDCKWAPESSWRGETVSAGTEAFSEPEALTLRNYVTEINPAGVVFWHSKAGNVYASECENGVLPKTLTLMEIYAEAAGYGQVPIFDAYPITGDAEGWLASIGIPAVTVEMKTHDTTEFIPNFNATVATLEHYSLAK